MSAFPRLIRAFLSRSQYLPRGFNLLEAAIVLGVVGLIIGGVWVGASAVRAHYLATKTVADVMQISQRLQASMSVAEADALPDWSSIVSYVIAAKIVPEDWVRGSNLVSPYGLYSGINITVNGGWFDFRVDVDSPSACYRLIREFRKVGQSNYGSIGITYLQTGVFTGNIMSLPEALPSHCATNGTEAVIVTFRFNRSR